jgi:hypothetical protein
MPTPNYDGSLVRTLADWGQFFDESGKPNRIIELMNQENTILDDLLFKEATHEDGNRTTLRTKLPEVIWRKLYKGIPFSKSAVASVKDPVGMLAGRTMIDVDLLELHGGQAKAYRESELRAHGEAMRQEVARALFYGSIKDNPDGVHGLHPRYPYRNSPHVIDAGGSGSECASMWGTVWGDNDLMGIFPKGSRAGLQHKAIPEYDAHDDEGDPFRAVGDEVKWYLGFSLADWRGVVRICNIPVADLTKAKGDDGFIDLHRLTIMAKNKIPAHKRPRMKWYVNEEVMTALELQASDAGNVQLRYGELFSSKNVPFLHGAPVRQCDALLTTETALEDAPV